MSVIEETNKRLKIAKEISAEIKDLVKCFFLGGSMGYGQNYSVTDKSDIDGVIICDKSKINQLSNKPYFKDQIPKKILELFKNGKINFFWVIKTIDNIEINTFIYETKNYIDFCQLNGKLIGYIPTKPQETQENYGFDRKLFTFKRNVTPIDEGFLYEKPALAENKFWGGPPRSDYYLDSYVLCQQDSFFDNLREKVWNATIKQLIREYGNSPDLDKFNILNSDFTYNKKPEKLPPEVLARVVKETKNRLLKLAPR